MRQSLGYFFTSVWLLTTACSSTVERPTPIDGLRVKYPYSILGEDYGLLSENDVATSACVAHPSPFSAKALSSHPYWQCFSLQDSSFECEEADINEEGSTAILAIVVKKHNMTNDYLSRRAIPLDACEAHKSDWIRLTDGQNHVCISGQFINEEKNYRSWIFESYKTAMGCDSYFTGGCSLTYQLQHGCDLATMAQPILKKE